MAQQAAYAGTMHLTHPELTVLDVKPATEDDLVYTSRYADVMLLHVPGQAPHMVGDPREVFYRLVQGHFTLTATLQVPKDMNGLLQVLLQQVEKAGSHVVFRLTFPPSDPRVWECLVPRAYQRRVERAIVETLEPWKL